VLENRFFRPLGSLAILASLPILEAGFQAARAFFRTSDALFTVTSALGTLAAVVLLLAGILLCCKVEAGRKVVYAAAWLSIPVHVFGTAIHLMGGHAVLYGVAYPIVIVLLLRRATPSGGVPGAADSEPGPTLIKPENPAQLRSALA
jgi:hypothetical protein